MPVSAPVSVTQSTAPAHHTKPAVEGQAWQTALDDAHGATNTQTQAAPPPVQTNKPTAAPASPLLASTLQSVSTRHNETPSSPSQPDDALIGANAKPAEKKEDQKNQPTGSLNALPAAALQVAPHTPDQTVQPATTAKSGAVAVDAAATTQPTDAPILETSVSSPGLGNAHPQASNHESVSLPTPADQNTSAKAAQNSSAKAAQNSSAKAAQNSSATAAQNSSAKAAQNSSATVDQTTVTAASLKPSQVRTTTAGSAATPTQTEQAAPSATSQGNAPQAKNTPKPVAKQTSTLQAATQIQTDQAPQSLASSSTPIQMNQTAQPSTPSVATTATTPTSQNVKPNSSVPTQTNRMADGAVHQASAKTASQTAAPDLATAQTGQSAQPSQPIASPTNQIADGKAHTTDAKTTGQVAVPNTDLTVSATTTSQLATATSEPVISAGAAQTVAPRATGTVSARPATSGKTAIVHTQPAASQPLAVSAVAAAQASGQLNSMDLKKSDSAPQNIQILGSVDGVSHAGAVTSAAQIAQASASAGLNSISLAPSALSATITALHQSGQNGITLRLDPPDLGHLSIQVKMDAQGAVNVLFVPSTADAAQALQNSLPQLGTALAQSGFTLGQAGVGGQFSQSGGQSGQQNSHTPTRQPVASFAESTPPSASGLSGLSAYA